MTEPNDDEHGPADDEPKSMGFNLFASWGALSARIHEEDDPTVRAELHRQRRRLGIVMAALMCVPVVWAIIQTR